MNKSLLELLKAEDLALYGYQSKHDLEMDTLKNGRRGTGKYKRHFPGKSR